MPGVFIRPIRAPVDSVAKPGLRDTLGRVTTAEWRVVWAGEVRAGELLVLVRSVRTGRGAVAHPVSGDAGGSIGTLEFIILRTAGTAELVRPVRAVRRIIANLGLRQTQGGTGALDRQGGGTGERRAVAGRIADGRGRVVGPRHLHVPHLDPSLGVQAPLQYL